jgi:uncharacterized membrane protein YphA (DoxX/SURF4 family)
VTENIHVNPSTSTDYVGRSGVYPMSGPHPAGAAAVRTQGALGHPEQRLLTSGRRDRSTTRGLGRLLLGGFFIYNGINHFKNRHAMAEYARLKHVQSPDLAVLASGALALLGGISILLGRQPKIGAAMVAMFLVGVTPRMHAFWEVDDEQQRTMELVQFSKNLALLGGVSFAAASAARS